MHRFYVAQGIHNDIISISDAEQLHHLKDVLRLKADDPVTVFDSEGNEYDCVITGLNKNKAALAVRRKRSVPGKKTRITVACAIPKGDKMDEIIDNLTQLGVDCIIPLETERVIVKLDAGKKEARLRRWRKIAQSAAQQSQRSSLPLVQPVTGIEYLIAQSQDFDLKLIPTLAGERKLIKEVLAEVKPESILVLIGPEGDFTPEEIELARNAGFIPISLGDSVLRVGTAAVAVASYLKLWLDA